MSGSPCGYASRNKREEGPAAALSDLSFKVRGPALLMLRNAPPSLSHYNDFYAARLPNRQVIKKKQIPILAGSQIYHWRTCLEWITICDEGRVSTVCRYHSCSTFTQGNTNSEYSMSPHF